MNGEIMPLLTKEQRTAINTAMPEDAKYGEVFEKIAEAQRDVDLVIYRQRLKEEAEWLEKFRKVICIPECQGHNPDEDCGGSCLFTEWVDERVTSLEAEAVK